MLILMTGATGFIGSHLACRLVGSGHEVRALARPSSNIEALIEAGVEVRVGDICDPRFLCDSVGGCDIVINAAGKLGKCGTSMEELRLANVALVKHLLETIQNTSVQQYIHFSTPGVVGMVGVAPECMPPRPGGAYERTKQEAEKLAQSYHRNGSVPVTILRPDFVYGPGDLHKLRMFKAVRDHKFPILWRGGSLLHPTYVEDVVDGTMLTLVNSKAFGQTFNLAGPSIITVRQLVNEIASVLDVGVRTIPAHPLLLKMAALAVETVCRAAGKEPPVTRQQVRFFTCDHASDISKAHSMLGYQPRIFPAEGVERTIAWYRRKGYL